MFRYGLLVGNDDLPPVTGRGNDSLKIDIYFLHKSMQDFLAAEYLVRTLHNNDGTFKSLIKSANSDFLQNNLMILLFALQSNLYLGHKEVHGFLAYISWWISRILEKNFASAIAEVFHFTKNSVLNRQNVCIERINMSGDVYELLIDLLKECDKTRELRFDKVCFGDNGFEGICTKRNITSLTLVDCISRKRDSMMDPSRSHSMTDLSTSYIEYINVKCSLQTPEIANLVENVLTFTYINLRKCQLSECNLTGDAIRSLSNVNSKGCLLNLVELYLDNNPGISGQLSNLFHKPKKWKMLQRLHAFNCELTEGDVWSVVENSPSYIPQCREHVEYIKLYSDNDIDRQTRFQKALQSWFEVANINDEQNTRKQFLIWRHGHFHRHEYEAQGHEAEVPSRL